MLEARLRRGSPSSPATKKAHDGVARFASCTTLRPHSPRGRAIACGSGGTLRDGIISSRPRRPRRRLPRSTPVGARELVSGLVAPHAHRDARSPHARTPKLRLSQPAGDHQSLRVVHCGTGAFGSIVGTDACQEEAQCRSAHRRGNGDPAGRHETEPHRGSLDRDARGARLSLEADRRASGGRGHPN